MKVTLLLLEQDVLFTRPALCCPDTLLFAIAFTLTLLNCVLLLIKDRIFTIDSNLRSNFHTMARLIILILYCGRLEHPHHHLKAVLGRRVLQHRSAAWGPHP